MSAPPPPPPPPGAPLPPPPAPLPPPSVAAAPVPSSSSGGGRAALLSAIAGGAKLRKRKVTLKRKDLEAIETKLRALYDGLCDRSQPDFTSVWRANEERVIERLQALKKELKNPTRRSLEDLYKKKERFRTSEDCTDVEAAIRQKEQELGDAKRLAREIKSSDPQAIITAGIAARRIDNELKALRQFAVDAQFDSKYGITGYGAETYQTAQSRCEGEGFDPNKTYLGEWNARKNDPDLVSLPPPPPGSFYIVSTSGTTELDGVRNWVRGDWVLRAEGGRWVNADKKQKSMTPWGMTLAIGTDAGSIQRQLRALVRGLDPSSAGYGGKLEASKRMVEQNLRCTENTDKKREITDAVKSEIKAAKSRAAGERQKEVFERLVQSGGITQEQFYIVAKKRGDNARKRAIDRGESKEDADAAAQRAFKSTLEQNFRTSFADLMASGQGSALLEVDIIKPLEEGTLRGPDGSTVGFETYYPMYKQSSGPKNLSSALAVINELKSKVKALEKGGGGGSSSARLLELERLNERLQKQLEAKSAIDGDIEKVAAIPATSAEDCKDVQELLALCEKKRDDIERSIEDLNGKLADALRSRDECVKSRRDFLARNMPALRRLALSKKRVEEMRAEIELERKRQAFVGEVQSFVSAFQAGELNDAQVVAERLKEFELLQCPLTSDACKRVETNIRALASLVNDALSL